MRDVRHFVVAGCRPWNRRIFDEMLAPLEGEWHFVQTADELSEVVDRVEPRYVFFLHWSWRVPSEIHERFECVVFHLTDLPYGRGGTPLQHMILAGHEKTVMSALRMVEELDAGPIYFKEPLSLHGTAEDIFARGARLSARMIRRFLREDLTPQPQEGEPTVFRRRVPAQSEIPTDLDLDGLHDFIRMLDADDYPKAFLRVGDLRVEFRSSTRYAERIEARVIVTRESAE